MNTHGQFLQTALAQIVGCYLPWLWLRKGGSNWLLLPAAASQARFAWLLTQHPTARGRDDAAYGGEYIGTALYRLWLLDG
ncbi:YnfA family protein, partial [Stenotrophomonas maltophilia]|uniref:YnfA family protein n=1 Tax=Stenotrophomonas maltophilia TaxID=40324 RepID=UPI00313E416F